MPLRKQYNAGEFKAHCLRIMDDISKTQREVVVSKRNQPMVRIVPFEEKKRGLFGCMKGTGTISGDLIAPIEESWDADR